MEENSAELVLGVVAVICTIGLPVFLGLIAFYMTIRSRHAERMALIEKGISPQEAPRRQKGPDSYPALRNGMFIVGIAVGALIGLFAQPCIPQETDWAELTIPIISLLGGGIAFIIYFFISRKMFANDRLQERSRDW